MNLNLYTISDVKNLKDIPASYLKVLFSNQFAYESAPFQLKAEEGAKTLGSVYAFPMQLCYKNELSDPNRFLSLEIFIAR